MSTNLPNDSKKTPTIDHYTEKNKSTDDRKTLLDWLNYMQGIHVSAIDMGLSRVLPVAEYLNLVNSAKDSQVFTVAGTNGKGSTTAVIAEICKQAGYKTALYQSPHLLKFNERVKIDGRAVDDETLIHAFEQVERARLACDLSLSFFEMTTLASMLIFAQANCEVWVLEVGLGGRLDVVNIIDPDVAVITNIGIDHVDWLGDDREKIGYEKAGILRKGIPLIYGEGGSKVSGDNEDKIDGEIDSETNHSNSTAIPKSVQARIEELGVTCYQMGRDFSYLASVVPAIITMVVVYIFLAKNTYKKLEAIMMNMQLEFQRLSKIKNPQLRSIDNAIEILKSGYPLGKWQFFIRQQLDAQIGVVYYTNNQVKQALPYLKNAFLRHWVARGMLGAYYFKKKDYDNMIKIFNEAIKTNKKVGLLYNMYAWCLVQINQKDKAIEILTQGVKILPNDKNLNTSLINLQNNKKIKLTIYGDEWYQFRLEKHPQEVMAQKPMFKTSKKQRIKRQ